MGETVAGFLAAAAIIGALVVIGRAVYWLWQVFRALARLADDLTGEPQRNGFPERPGVLERLSRIEAAVVPVPVLEERLAAMDARLAAIEGQMQPNGGGSLRDAIDKLVPPTSRMEES